MMFDWSTILWVGGGILAAVFLVIFILKEFFIICPPHQVLVVSGRKRTNKISGESEGFQKTFGGFVWRIPLLQEINYMNLTTIPINIVVKNAYSKGGIALHVEAVANVKITSDHNIINNAIERFLGRDTEEITRAVQDTLEGNLREVLATLTPEQVNEDRLIFAKSLSEVAEDDLRKLGLHLDTLKIQHVSDNSKYLDSIGRQRIALILRDAEIAESNARREAENVAAKVRAEAQVVKEQTQAEVAKSRNALRQFKADLEAKARSEEEKTIAAAQEARARAEQALQQIRMELEELRLQADQVLPAEAQKQARELIAKGAAAPIAENGKAIASALNEMASAWGEAGEQARDIFIIQQLEKILSIVVGSVKDTVINKVHLIDKGDGQALPNYVKAFPDTVAAILQSLYKTTGINVIDVLTSSTKQLTSGKE